jgi:hypothetical protein
MLIIDTALRIFSRQPSKYAAVRGGAVGWGTALQTGRSRVRFPMESLEFFSDLILIVAPIVALGSTQPLTEMSTRNPSCG